MSSKNRIHVTDGNSKIALSVAAHRCAQVIQDNCEDAVFVVRILSTCKSIEEQQKYGQEFAVRMLIGPDGGKVLHIEGSFDTNENYFRVSNQFATIGNREIVLNRIMNAFYDFLAEIDRVCDRTVFSAKFDMGMRFRNIYYAPCTKPNEEKGSYNLTISSMPEDWAGLADDIKNFIDA